MPENRAFSAAACMLMLHGKEIGWATGFRATENFNLFPIDVMGDLRTKRYEPVAMKFAGSFEMIHIKREPLSHYTANGGEELWLGGATNNSDYKVINFEPKELTLVDLYAGGVGVGETVLQLTGWLPESRSWSLSYGGVMTANVSFVCRDIREFKAGPGV